MLTLLLGSVLLLPQGTTSRPTSRPSAPSDLDRVTEARWDDDAPGEHVLVQDGKHLKFLPMTRPRYGSAEDVADRVREKDLVIGLVVDGQAFAYPINMLGGPQREIVNDEHGQVAFCVNW